MTESIPCRDLFHLLNRLEAEAAGGPPVCLAVVRRSGVLAALVSLDGTPERAVSLAQRKAYTAMRMECPTRSFHERLLRESLSLADFCDSTFTSLEGGVPLFDHGGRCIGGLGISGLKPEEDGALAERLARILTEG